MNPTLWTLIIVALIAALGSITASITAAIIARSTHKAVNSRMDAFKAEYESRLKKVEAKAFQDGMAQQRKDDAP